MSTDQSRRDMLLDELTRYTYVMVRPSAIAGVGVFALRAIPAGCRAMFGPPDPEDAWTSLPRADVDALPPHARQLVETYCLYDADHYFVPTQGFKRMDLACFVNHSDEPNIRSIQDGDYFEAVRRIEIGEELLIDYGQIVDDDTSTGDAHA